MAITPAAFSIKDAAVYIGISRANLYRIMQSGKLRPAKVGGRTLIRRVDADAFLEQCLAPNEFTTSDTSKREVSDRPEMNIFG